MHHAMLYDPIQGQEQGHACFKAIQDRQSRTGLIFLGVVPS